MIITKLIGGLGNQLFQYAVARRLAYVNHDRLKLDLTGFRDYPLRDYSLNSLRIIAEIAGDEEILNFKNNNRVVKEKYFQFDPDILSLETDVYLEGYWQSPKYFVEIEGIIRREFQPKRAPEGKNAVLSRKISDRNAVAVHIRRGDYAQNPVTNQYHGVCSLDYYYRAAALVAGRVADPHFFIFSDDGEWPLRNLKLNYPTTFIIDNFDNPGEDLRLISLCRHHIIANSSFSWWGAWLGASPGQIVVAPRRWFNRPEINTKDLIPDNWIVLESS